MQETKEIWCSRKLSPRCIGSYEILRRVGAVAYRLALPPKFEGIHNVFYVSNLRKYVYHPGHILELESVDLQENMTYEDYPDERLLGDWKKLCANPTLIYLTRRIEVVDALITVEAVLVLFTPRRARLFLTQFETWILVVDTTTGRSFLNDELRSSHLYWIRRLRLPQLTVPSGADLVGESARSAAEPAGNFLVVLTPLTIQVPVRALWPRIEARAQHPS
uniref:Tf2-1-like SH3-like domain-containing protein n=1 Tax=Ananas comosus var. bracteatus TaxID=296719 RepID=A0A6V7P4T7_ANACO|nr:unnamed protein product [Ananas comosus var. bracteatus]